jgi:hypothetical protein
MTFGDAIEYLKAGHTLYREGWLNGDRLTCSCTSDMQFFLEVSYGDKEPIPYFAGNADIFADDWRLMD